MPPPTDERLSEWILVPLGAFLTLRNSMTFRIGDKVRLIETNGDRMPRGSTGTVSRLYSDRTYMFPMIDVIWDELDVVSGGWYTSRFELVTEPVQEYDPDAQDGVSIFLGHDHIDILETLVKDEIERLSTEDDFYYIEQLFDIRKLLATAK